MKNIVENIAVILVVVFSVAIVLLIVQYNLIEDESIAHFNTTNSVVKQVSQEQKNTNYLKDMEAHKEVNIKVDPKRESHFNQVTVKSEMTDNRVSEVIEREEEPKANRLDAIGDAIDKLLN